MTSAPSGTSENGRDAVAALLEQLRAEAATALTTCERWFDGDAEAGRALQQALTQLDQVAGLSGLDGIGALADECRLVAAALDLDDADRRQALAEGLVALGGRLRALKPGEFAPVDAFVADLNALRAARGEPPFPEAELFARRLAARAPFAVPFAGSDTTGASQQAVAARVLEPSRKIFAALRRGGDPKPALEAVRKLATALERAARSGDEAMPWWIARVLADAAYAGRLAYDDAVAGQLEALAPLVDAVAAGRDATADGAAWTYRAVHPLVALGRADDELARVFDVFGLADDAAAADDDSGAADDARRAVAEAAREELARVRDAFDVFLRSGASDTDLLKPAVARLDTIVAPLRVAGIADAADLLGDARTALAALVDGEPLGNAANAIADQLLQAESLLSAGVDGPGDRMRDDALRALVDAAHDQLAGVRQAVFEASEVGESDALAQVPDALAHLAGALAVAGLDDAASLAAEIGGAAPTRAADAQTHELLAEAMVCLELYLGARRDGDASGGLLTRAREVLARAAPAGGARAAADDSEPPVVAGEPDPDLLDVYLDEARECVAAARERLATWRADPADADSRTDLQRAFHTLKGSGRMVGALRTAEFARSFEELLERVGEVAAAPPPPVVELVGAALAVLPALLEQIESGQDPAVSLKPLQTAAALTDLARVPGGLAAQVLAASVARDAGTVARWLDAAAAGAASGAVPAAVVDALAAIEVAATTAGDPQVAGDARALRERIAGAPAIDDALRRDANAVLDAWRRAPTTGAAGDGVDAGTAAAYRDEAHALLDRMGDACDALLLDAANADAVLAMQRALHTLKGASRAAGYRALSDVAHALEDVLRAVAQERMLVTPRLLWTLQRVFDAMYGMLEVETADRAGERAARVMDELKQLSDDDRSPPPLTSGADRRRKPRVAAESERVRSDQFDRALVRALSLGLRSTELDRRLREQTMWDIAELGDELAALAADAAAIRDLLVRARVAPVHTHASRWRRTVRQAAEDTGKEVELRFEGSDHELDRRLLDALVMPLEHLLRNAVAHGVETTFARRAAGKPAAGTIVIRTTVEPAGLRIEVEDDGAGVDVDKVRRTARERGMAIGDGEVPPAKLLALLATPGFSTAAAVTHAAGYGIGLDTVVAALRELGGELALETTPGSGTRFVLHLPHASPVVAVELVRSGSALVALPPDAVVATRATTPGAATVEHDGDTWPVLDLADCIGLDGARAGADASIAVLLSSERRGVAVVVDEHLGRVETAMHRLRPGDLREGVCVAGVGLLDGGRLATVLNAKAAVRGAKSALAIKPLAFVADDSNTARDEAVRKLERAGWRVRTVGDGDAAREALARLQPELVVLDIDMPGQDGLAVLEWMRGRAEHERTPVVLASARLDDARRARAAVLHAVCVAKPFNGTEFEDAVAALVSRA